MANLGHLKPITIANSGHLKPDKCGGLPSPETTEQLASANAAWDLAILKQRTEERDELATKLATAQRLLANEKRQNLRARDALRKIRLGHPCDLHDLIAADALEAMEAVSKNLPVPAPRARNGGVCELKMKD